MKPSGWIPSNKDVILQNHQIRKFPPSSLQISIRLCHSPNNVLCLVKGPSLVSGVAFGCRTRDFSTSLALALWRWQTHYLVNVSHVPSWLDSGWEVMRFWGQNHPREAASSHCTLSGGTRFWFAPFLVNLTWLQWCLSFLPCKIIVFPFATDKYYFETNNNSS